MLMRVRTRASTYANSQRISSSTVLSEAKLIYYRIFMWMYANALRRAAFVMANSTWTKEHVDGILEYRDMVMDTLVNGAAGVLDAVSICGPILEKTVPPREALTVYPPCETQELVGFPLQGREKVIVSIAQFRPEKDHAAQLRSLAELFKQHPQYQNDVRMVMVGGCRNDEDNTRVEGLKRLSKELNISVRLSLVC